MTAGSLLIRNGRIVTPDGVVHGDLLTENGVISQIAERVFGQADTTIDAAGRLVIPGGIDPHTHLRLEAGGTVSSDDWESGTRAAAFGGTTTIIDFATPAPGQDVWVEYERRRRQADGIVCVDYGLHAVLTRFEDSDLQSMRRLLEEGVSSFKMFMAYPGVLYADDGTIFRAMRAASDAGALITMHAESGLAIQELVKEAAARGETSPASHASTRPAITEGEAVHRAIVLAELARCPLYIVHLSTAKGLDEVRSARHEGQNVYAETCPQYLLLDESLYASEGFEGAKYVMTPPLRSKSDQRALWDGLEEGSVQTVGTDHCPFRFADQKVVGIHDFRKIPNGAPGIENRLSLLYSEMIVKRGMSMDLFVNLVSTNAARLFGLYPRKGILAPGSDADIVIFDPDRTEIISVSNPATHHMNVDYNAYEGFQVQGMPEVVILRGQVICADRQFMGYGGQGRFLARERFVS